MASPIEVQPPPGLPQSASAGAAADWAQEFMAPSWWPQAPPAGVLELPHVSNGWQEAMAMPPGLAPMLPSLLASASRHSKSWRFDQKLKWTEPLKVGSGAFDASEALQRSLEEFLRQRSTACSAGRSAVGGLVALPPSQQHDAGSWGTEDAVRPA